MSKITISTFQLFEMFPNQESARKYLESKLWASRRKMPGLWKYGERVTPPESRAFTAAIPAKKILP